MSTFGFQLLPPAIEFSGGWKIRRDLRGGDTGSSPNSINYLLWLRLNQTRDGQKKMFSRKRAAEPGAEGDPSHASSAGTTVG